MMRKFRPTVTHGLIVVTGLVCIVLMVFSVFLVSSNKSAYSYPTPKDPNSTEFERFPVSVNPIKKEIVDDPLIDWYVRQHLSLDVDANRHQRKFKRVISELANLAVFQQLASPISRTLVIYPGERREEVASNFGDILRWDETQRETFLSLVSNESPIIADGKFFPGRYIVPKSASPETLAELVTAEFSSEVLSRYDKTIESVVPLTDALTIASLLEREAFDFNDMRVISGIIWNRLFISMPLQLDATLQYARASEGTDDKWWPKVVPADKYIDSPFNTYQETNLPPAPIANPSIESIVAALNPRETNCLFYFHDQDGAFYCSPTYEGHVELLKQVYGQGR